MTIIKVKNFKIKLEEIKSVRSNKLNESSRAHCKNMFIHGLFCVVVLPKLGKIMEHSFSFSIYMFFNLSKDIISVL